MHVDRESTQTDQSFHLIGSLTEIVAGQTMGAIVARSLRGCGLEGSELGKVELGASLSKIQ
jgi:hypothetical protein